MLKGWTALAGESEFSLRFFSVMPSVLSVPLIFVLGRRLLGAPTGLIAALLLVCSSYALFYAQMVKMYGLVLMLGLLSCYLLLSRRWAWYAVVTTVAMHVHVFGALLIPWHVAYTVVRRRFERGFLIALAVLVVPYLPLAVLRLTALRAPETLTRQFTGPTEPVGMVITLAREYGARYDLVSGDLLAGAFTILTIGGFAVARSWFLGIGLLVPVVIAYVLVVLGAPLFASRYLLVTLPAFYVGWAALLLRWKPIGAVLIAAFILINGARWWESAIEGKRFREDWRSAVAYLEERHAPGEAVLVLHDASWRAVDYYRTEPMLLTSLDGGPERPPDLSKAPSPSGRAWLLAAYFEVPDLPTVEGWLESRGQLANKTWLTGVMVSEYRLE